MISIISVLSALRAGRSVHRHDEGMTALLHQRVGSGFLVCWRLGHGYRLSLDIGYELVKKCNTF